MRFLTDTTNYLVSLINMDIAHEAVVKGAEECVFMDEYDNVYTAGKSFEYRDIIGNNLKIYHIGRGGRITVHSKGQIVCYPIINLRRRNINIHDFVFLLEQWMIDMLSDVGVKASRNKKGIGAWVDNSKIGFVGIRVEKGVSKHGICLNVSNDLRLFDKIIPCGLQNIKITSIEQETGNRFTSEQISHFLKSRCPF